MKKKPSAAPPKDQWEGLWRDREADRSSIFGERLEKAARECRLEIERAPMHDRVDAFWRGISKIAGEMRLELAGQVVLGLNQARRHDRRQEWAQNQGLNGMIRSFKLDVDENGNDLIDEQLWQMFRPWIIYVLEGSHDGEMLGKKWEAPAWFPAEQGTDGLKKRVVKVVHSAIREGMTLPPPSKRGRPRKTKLTQEEKRLHKVLRATCDVSNVNERCHLLDKEAIPPSGNLAKYETFQRALADDPRATRDWLRFHTDAAIKARNPVR
jgi:hypothetical protein